MDGTNSSSNQTGEYSGWHGDRPPDVLNLAVAPPDSMDKTPVSRRARMKEARQDIMIGLIIAFMLVLSGTTYWLWDRVEQLATNLSVLTQEDLSDAVLIPSALKFWRTQNGNERPNDG